MPLTLRTARRSQSVTLIRAHLLKGPYPDRPGRVYLVPHNRAWYAYPLSPEDSVRLPGDPPRTRLHYGDELTVGGLILEVEEATVCRESPLEPGDGRTACRFEVVGHGQSLAAGDVTLIGTAAHCDFRLPEADGVAPVHAVLARAEGRWVLYDVSRGRPESPGWSALRDGDTVSFGPLRFEFEIFPEAELEASQAANTADVAASDTADIAPPPEVAADAPLDHVQGPAALMCRWVQIAAKSQTPPPMPVPQLPADKRSLPPAELARVQALIDLAHKLAARPHDKPTLNRFAGFLSECGYADLYRLMARRVFHLDQTDPHAAAAVAEAYLAAGREAHQPVEERRKRLDEAERFAAIAVELAASAPEFKALQSAVSVERTLANLQAGRAAAKPAPPRRPVPGVTW